MICNMANDMVRCMPSADPATRPHWQAGWLSGRSGKSLLTCGIEAIASPTSWAVKVSM